MRALPPSRYDCSVLPAGQAKRVGECIVDRTCDRTAARSARPAHGKRAARGSSVHARAERAQGGWPARQHAASSRGLAFESHEVTRHAFPWARRVPRSSPGLGPSTEHTRHARARALDCCLAAAEPAGEPIAPVDEEAAPMGFSSKFSRTGRVEGLPTAVPALDTVAGTISVMMAVALPSEHHRLASGHAGSRWASMEVPRVEVSKIRLGSPLTVFPKDKYTQWKDGIAWTQRRGAPLLAAPLPKSHVERSRLWGVGGVGVFS